MVVLVPGVAVHRVIARRLGCLVLVEVGEALQEEHREEPDRDREHQ